MTDDRIAWLRAQLDEDAWWARESSRPDWGDDTVPYTEGGEHWRWMNATTDEVVPIDPAVDEYVADGELLYLGSAERYRSRALGAEPLLHIALSECVEMAPAVAGHIARWDPARVLAEVDAKRRIPQRV